VSEREREGKYMEEKLGKVISEGYRVFECILIINKEV